MPAKKIITDISSELSRMNNFIGDLDGRNKQLIEINKRKLQQNI